MKEEGKEEMKIHTAFSRKGNFSSNGYRILVAMPLNKKPIFLFLNLNLQGFLCHHHIGANLEQFEHRTVQEGDENVRFLYDLMFMFSKP